MNKREMILNVLAAFIRQRPGFEPGDYSTWQSYRAEMREVTRDRHIAERLLADVRWRVESIPEQALRDAFRAFSGRLTLTDRPDGSIALDYCTGQYFPTEYRKAVCAVLAQALWAAARENMPPPLQDTEAFGGLYSQFVGNEKSPTAVSCGQYLRNKFRREYGRSIARRFFD